MQEDHKMHVPKILGCSHTQDFTLDFVNVKRENYKRTTMIQPWSPLRNGNHPHIAHIHSYTYTV